jgi:ribosome-binding factor A
VRAADAQKIAAISEMKVKRSVGQRSLRVGEELRHALSGILYRGECHDPALREASIAVTEVRFSPDLRNATVFVMPLGGVNAPEIVAGLRRGAPFLKRLLAREMPLRYTPNLIFELDLSFDQADRIAALLARPEVEQDLGRNAARTQSDDDAG